jgi:uncharacterized protein YjbI with pentapeptide repeats
MRTPARRPAAPELPDARAVVDLAAGLGDEARLGEVDVSGAAEGPVAARSVVIEGGRVTASLPGARLPALRLHDAVLAGADLANAALRGATLHRVEIRDCRLTGLSLLEASLRDVTITGCQADFAVLAAARLERVAFTGCRLGEAAFDDARLHDVRFEACDLTRSTFGHASLSRVELAGCELEGLRSLADLRGASMPWPDLVANAGRFAALAGVTVLDDDG